ARSMRTRRPASASAACAGCRPTPPASAAAASRPARTAPAAVFPAHWVDTTAVVQAVPVRWRSSRPHTRGDAGPVPEPASPQLTSCATSRRTAALPRRARAPLDGQALWVPGRRAGNASFARNGRQQQVLVVVAEIRQRRGGLHRDPVDLAGGIEVEGDIGRLEGAVVPRGAEGVVLPVLERAGHARRLFELDPQLAAFVVDVD